jgi:hypothetical protein
MKLVTPKAVNVNTVDAPEIENSKSLAVVPPKPAAEDSLQRETERDDADFDWVNDDSIILREQPSTAVYFNKEGTLVIRQRRWPDEDTFVYIAETSIGEFLDKITDVCGVPSFGGPG